jgi:raffinose/stachyose/melibiose transport system permease protein
MTRRRLFSLFISILLVMIAIFFFLPVFLTILNSFKSMEEMTKPFYAPPNHLALDNFRQVFGTTHMASAFLYSVIIVASSVTGIVILTSMASYVIARRNSLYNRIIHVVFIAGLMIPFTVLMIPLMKVVGFLKIGNIYGLIVIYLALGMSLPVFLLTGFIKGSVPLELEESAHMDGAGIFRIFASIVMPLLKPILATVIMLGTVWIFNDFLLPSLLLSSKRFTIPLSQYQLAGQYLQWYNLMLAGFTITFIPLFALFLSFQRYFIRGVTEGALKG